jgi:mono/diheme cytochrome c family protein
LKTMRFLLPLGALSLIPLLAGAAVKPVRAVAPPKNEPDPYEIPDAARERRNPILRSDDTIRQGQALWQKHCETCHGTQGRGDGPNARLHEQRRGHAPRNLTESKVQDNLTDGEIFWRITKGLSEDGKIIMPSYEQKVPGEAQRWQLVLFVRELGQAAKR